MSELTAGVTVSADPGAGFGLEGKIAIVTGAASGIGRATAELLARTGAAVTAIDIDPKGFADLDLGRDGAADTADLSVPAACEQVVDDVLRRHGRLDILVNAAAILRRVAIKDVDAALWEQMMDTNLLSQFAMCRAAIRPMRKQKWGRVVVIASTAAFNGGADNSSVYAIGKGGGLALTKSLARQVAADGITVNAVLPALTDTPGTSAHPEEFKRLVWEQQAIKRFASADDIVGPVLFLTTDDAAFMTGQALVVDGGLYKIS